MNCSDAQRRLLEADLEELEGSAETELADHLETCARCREDAGRIVAGQRALARAFDSHKPRTPVAAAVRVARERSAHRRRRRRLWQTALPVGAAASIAIAVLSRDGTEPPPTAAPEVTSSFGAAVVDVVAPPSKTVAVFEIADRPDVVIVWFFDKGDETS